jgi:hypothetical protein
MAPFSKKWFYIYPIAFSIIRYCLHTSELVIVALKKQKKKRKITPGRLWPGLNLEVSTASRSAACGGPNKFNAEGPHSTYGYRGQRFWDELFLNAR